MVEDSFLTDDPSAHSFSSPISAVAPTEASPKYDRAKDRSRSVLMPPEECDDSPIIRSRPKGRRRAVWPSSSGDSADLKPMETSGAQFNRTREIGAVVPSDEEEEGRETSESSGGEAEKDGAAETVLNGHAVEPDKDDDLIVLNDSVFSTGSNGTVSDSSRLVAVPNSVIFQKLRLAIFSSECSNSPLAYYSY